METLLDLVSSMPDYVGKGIITLFIYTMGGLLVGFFTSGVFARMNETNAVRGAQLKRRHETYEHLYAQIEKLRDCVVPPDAIHRAALEILQKVGLPVDLSTSNQLFRIFETPKTLTDTFLDLDRYIAMRRIQFDETVSIQALRFQNYLIAFRKVLSLYEEQFVDMHISLDDQCVMAGERILSIALGILMKDELSDQIDAMQSALKSSLNNPDFKYRKVVHHSYKYYNDEKGPILSYLKDTIILSKNEQIKQLVVEAIGIGMVGHCHHAKKKKRR